MAKVLNQVASEERVTAINEKLEKSVLCQKFIQEDDLDLSLRTIFNGDYQEVEDDGIWGDKVLFFHEMSISVIDIYTYTFITNCDPHIFYTKSDDEYRLVFGSDIEAPKSIIFEGYRTLCEVIEIAKDELIYYQSSLISKLFDFIEFHKDLYSKEKWDNGVKIEVGKYDDKYCFIDDLICFIPQKLVNKVEKYLTKLNIKNIEFNNGFVYINQ